MIAPSSRWLSSSLLSVFALVAAGCGQPVVMDDAFVPAEDAYVPGPDAPSDVDGDGVLSSIDCNDGDAAVGTSGTRACTSRCGIGNETCSNGAWSACSAPTDCDCTMPGATRLAPCGNCGMQNQTCTSGTWTAGSACLNEGDCAVGAVETMATLSCGEQQRLCGATCAWGEWQQTVPNGECRPGFTMTCDRPEGTNRRCNDDCTWSECMFL